MAFSLVGFLKGILIQDPVDRTKQLELNISSSATTGTKTTIVAQQTGNRLVTLPDSDFDFNEVITETSVSTLSNKTLDNTNIITVKDSNLTIQNTADTTKHVKFDLSGITTGTTRTIPLPDSNATLVNISSAQTLSNKTLDNTTIETIKASNLTIQDPSDVTKQVQLNVSAVSTGTTRTVSIPDASLIVVGTATTQTLTNKTLTGNTAANLINGSGTLNLNSSGSITVPNATDTLVGKATTDILSNKSFPSVVLNGSVSGTATLQAANTTSSYSIKFPSAQGAASTVPTNDGSGNLSWASTLTNPMTTGGDIIYGGASGVPTRLANGALGQVLQSNGGTTAPSWITPGINFQYFSTPTTTTFTAPANRNSSTVYKITCVGGGASGGTSSGSVGGGGGGGGGTAVTYLTGLSPSSSTTLTVGGGGGAIVAGNTAGSAGGFSSFGAGPSCRAEGGSPGQNNTGSVRGGAGGIGFIGDLLFSGNAGSGGYTVAGISNFGGIGGGSTFGGGGTGAFVTTLGGDGTKGGGGGGGNSAIGSGAGGSGFVLVEWI